MSRKILKMENFLFDFDGTIADSGDAATLATQACFKDFDLEIPTNDQVRYYMGVPIETFIPELVEKQGKDFADEQYNEMYQSFREHYSEIEMQTTTLFPGMKTTLEQLKNEGKRLFVVSSKNSISLKRNLKHLGIASLFEDLVGSDQVENYKPAPDGILILLDRYHLDKKQSVMIGDAKYDLQMGKRADIKTCGCLWDTFDKELLEKEHPTYLIEHPSDLLKL